MWTPPYTDTLLPALPAVRLNLADNGEARGRETHERARDGAWPAVPAHGRGRATVALAVASALV